MEGKARIVGLKDAMAAMAAAFPKDPKKQRGILGGAMRMAASKTILPSAKRRALSSDGSGALSESLGIRTQSSRKTGSKGIAAGIEIVPVRSNRKAIALYINHYYAQRGKAAPANIVTSGIRHGHLVEFGTRHHAAKPYLWPAAQSQTKSYIRRFARDLSKKIESAVRLRAKKRTKK